ncbi:MAG TPA: hypothetical protein VKU00_08920 [Chthonomonadaceae bacterium]|nr:hypothetical protein [Chthonomonadaceae bacterium]
MPDTEYNKAVTDVASVIVATGGSATGGAFVGAAIGGPAGAVVGGLLGGVLGAASSISHSDKSVVCAVDSSKEQGDHSK